MAFRKISSREIADLGAVLEEYEHERLGARHIHIRRDDPEMGFAAAFPTHWGGDDGRAHILEHLSLCGSERFPVKDPFFAMSRRSLASFMNALTYADRTVYPFATKDPEDFANLLGVYLDATLFPNLDYLDFRQEGWRLEEGKDGKLAFHGVVYNEMKGALSTPGSWVWKGMERALKPGTAYAGMSGGDPLAIPDLTHEELKRFHAQHYHPSRGVFMTYGSADPAMVQEALEKAFGRFEERLDPLPLSKAPAPSRPIERIEETVPAQEGSEGEISAQIGWVLGDLEDEDAAIDAALLQQALFQDASAPMRNAIETAGLGRMSGLCGADGESAQITFHMGVDGLAGAEEAERAFALMRSALADFAEKGIEPERVESILRDFELDQLDIEPSGEPLGISLMLDAIPLAMAGLDPIQGLDLAPALERARSRWLRGDRAREMAREMLASGWSAESVFRPDLEFFAKRDAIEAERLERERARMAPEDLERIRAEAKALRERQGADSGADRLPKVNLAKVSRKAPESMEFETIEGQGRPTLALFGAKSNGVSAIDLEIRADSLPRDLWPWASLWCSLRGSLGVGKMGWEEAAAWRSRLGGGPASSIAAVSRAGSEAFGIRVALRAVGLDREAGNLPILIGRALSEARFDEADRIAFLLDSGARRQAKGLGNMGPKIASLMASGPFSATADFDEALDGIGGLGLWRMASEMSKSPRGREIVRERLEAVSEALGKMPAAILAIGSGKAAAAAEILRSDLAGMPGAPVRQESPLSSASRVPRAGALSAPGAVSHCHAAWRAPAMGEEGSSDMAALAELVGNAYLHRALREEGGAYGGSARYSPKGAFAMSSYQDPRVEGTYRDFAKAAEWAAGGHASEREIEEAKISALQALEASRGPRGLARAAWDRASLGLGQEERDRYREGILDATGKSLKAAAERWLIGSEVSRAAFVAERHAAEARGAGLSVERASEAIGAEAKRQEQASGAPEKPKAKRSR